MTSVVAWERSVGVLSELVIASDSRLSGGESWDACAKIFDVGRDDAVLAFAGDTLRALPLVLQAIATSRTFQGSATRTLDLPHFAGHLNNVLNAVLMEVRSEAVGLSTTNLSDPKCEFILAGWSWKSSAFRIYRFRYVRSKGAFTCFHAPKRLPSAIRGPGRGALYTTIGDASVRLTGSLARAYNLGEIDGPLGYHPLEYLYRQALDPGERTVGGPVQVAKVYRSIRVEHFATRTNGRAALAGRPRLDYENTTLRTLERNDAGCWGITKDYQSDAATTTDEMATRLENAISGEPSI